MSAGPESAEIARAGAHLAPYARHLLERCAAYALSLHADEIGPEHLLSTLMDDEDCAAHRAALHAFADPASISEEARALSSGIMVTGSAASLPFSERGVRMLERARALAGSRGRSEVDPAHLALAAARELPDELRRELDAAGWNEGALEGNGPTDTPRSFEGEPLFRRFSERAKRLLSASARVARSADARAISPAHVLLAALQSEPELERAGGISAARARSILRGKSEDPTPFAPRALAADDALAAFLGGNAPGATSLELLERYHAGATPELAQLLARHKVTPALLERCRGVFVDPPAP